MLSMNSPGARWVQAAPDSSTAVATGAHQESLGLDTSTMCRTPAFAASVVTSRTVFSSGARYIFSTPSNTPWSDSTRPM
jgi:hypothetical protein